MVNLGMFGVKSCAPIIREPQACALALGVIENRIVPNDNAESEDIYKESVMMVVTGEQFTSSWGSYPHIIPFNKVCTFLQAKQQNQQL